MSPMRPAPLARLLAVFLGGLGLGGIWLWVPLEEGWRNGTLVGAGLGCGASFATFELRLRELLTRSKPNPAGLFTGLFLNLAILCGGTILARYTGWPGHYQGFAFGFVGAVLLLKVVFTWALHREGIDRTRR